MEFSIWEFPKIRGTLVWTPENRILLFLGRGRGLSKLVLSRVIIGVTPFRALITLLITYLLSPLPLQVGSPVFGSPELQRSAALGAPRILDK